MFKASRSLCLRACVAALCASIAVAGTTVAASPSQTPIGGGSAVFDNLLFVVIGGVLMALFASIAGGAVIAFLATGLSRFFRRNLPTEEEMVEVRAEVSKSDQPRVRRLQIGPAAEPFVLSALGFVAFLILTSVALSATPQPVRGEEAAAGGQEAAAAALPKEGDLGSITDGLPEGNPDNGAQVFNTAGCVGCHSQKKDERLVGPTFYNLWNTAATRVPGLTEREYLYQSIVDPNAYVVETFQPNIMQQNYAALLSPQQMADILAWIEQRHKDEP